ncbi:MAG: nitroreductase family protein [Pseudomonadales bacterium]|nr:nitroreductase family protein [Pseudomonadales bacterium]
MTAPLNESGTTLATDTTMDTGSTENNESVWSDIKDGLKRGKTVDGYDYKAKKRYYEPAPDVNSDEFKKVVESRRSVRKFTDKKIPQDVLDACLDMAIMAPSSCNLQPWEFHVVQSPDKKSKLVEACMSQNAAKTAAELIVVVARTKNWHKVAQLNLEHWPQENMPRHWVNFYKTGVPFTYWQGPMYAVGAVKKAFSSVAGIFSPVPRGPFTKSDMRVWAIKSVALAAENLMLAFRAHGFDSCPMEGMDERRVRKLLKLPSDAEVVMVLGAGERADDGVYFPRVKFDKSNFVNYV